VVTALARRFKVDVSTDNATWVNLKGIDDFNYQINPSKVASDTYDTNGWSSFEIPMNAWVTTIKAFRVTNAGVFDPGQEMVRAARGQSGTAARVYVRWYDRNGAPEAFSGLAIVEWNPSKTAVGDLDEIQIILTGDGILTSITNPYSAAVIPVITAASPSGVGAAGIVNITGSAFTGTIATTGVKFGGVNATSWIVVSDNTIVAVMPAGSAGSAPIIVTNAAGASSSFPYTRT
jgi:hypothetical protein